MPATTIVTAELLETSIGTTTNNGPRITKIWHVAEHTIRVRVACDSYRPQSYALAEVLTPACEWTKVCETAPEEFHWQPGNKRPGANKVTRNLTEDELLALADDLMRRAARILRVTAA